VRSLPQARIDRLARARLARLAPKINRPARKPITPHQKLVGDLVAEGAQVRGFRKAAISFTRDFITNWNGTVPDFYAAEAALDLASEVEYTGDRLRGFVPDAWGIGLCNRVGCCADRVAPIWWHSELHIFEVVVSNEISDRKLRAYSDAFFWGDEFTSNVARLFRVDRWGNTLELGIS